MKAKLQQKSQKWPDASTEIPRSNHRQSQGRIQVANEGPGSQTGEQAWAEGRSEGKRLRPKFYTYVRTRRHKDNLGTSTGMHSMHLENKLHSGIIHRLKRKKKLGASVTRRNLEPSYIALLVHDRGHKAQFRKNRILYFESWEANKLEYFFEGVTNNTYVTLHMHFFV